MVIATTKGRYLQSYNCIVAYLPAVPQEKIRVGRNYDYSMTTIYYVGKFLGMTLQDIRHGIEQGTIEYDENLGIR
jgi:hypothetical protein